MILRRNSGKFDTVVLQYLGQLQVKDGRGFVHLPRFAIVVGYLVTNFVLTHGRLDHLMLLHPMDEHAVGFAGRGGAEGLREQQIHNQKGGAEKNHQSDYLT